MDRKEVKQYIFDTAIDMVAYSRKHFRYNKAFPRIIVGFSDRYVQSLGGCDDYGEPYMFFDTAKYLDESEPFIEYPHIHNDLVIGGFEGSPKKKLAAVVAHELSHVIEIVMNMKKYPFPKAAYKRAYKGTSKDAIEHGVHFQYFYRILRKKFVNKLQ